MESGEMNNNNFTEINAKEIDRWVEEGWEWGIPITSEEFENAKNGEWDVLLTPTKFMPHDWLLPFLKSGRLDGVCLLGLASGGGQQMPIFSALGADCTVILYKEPSWYTIYRPRGLLVFDDAPLQLLQ
jgi:hypothetical protein